MRSHLLLLFLLSTVLMTAQDGRWLSVRASHGYLLPHRVVVEHLLQGPAQTLAFEYSVGTKGNKDWHHHFARPQQGIGVYWKGTGAPDQLGDALSVYSFLRLPLTDMSSHGLVFDVAVGLVYVTETYDYETNPRSSAIGSHMNYGAIVGLRYQAQRKAWMLRTGPSVSHASNAAFELPNLGINVLSWDMILSYRISTAENWERRKDFYIDKEVEWSASVNGGLREGEASSGIRYGAQELRATRRKRFSHKLSYSLGADIIHNRASYIRETASPSIQESLQAGIHGGIGMHFESYELFFQQGIYLNQGLQEQGAFYHRFGGRKKFSGGLFMELGLKTHFAKADYLSFGLGRYWRTKTSSTDES